MRKLALLLAAVTTLGAAPANAADDNMLTTVAMVPVKAAAFATGAVFGTPIAVTRYVAKESVSATKSVAKDSDNPMMLGAASLIGVPVGLFIGGVEGMYWGTANSWKHSSESPFGKDSFSLGEIE